MRKKYIFCIVLALSALLSSCGMVGEVTNADITTDNNNKNDIAWDTAINVNTNYGSYCEYGDYIYYQSVSHSKEKCGLMRYDPEKRESTPACLDPACDHESDTECPFGKNGIVSVSAIKDNKIYYLLLGRSGELPEEFRCYDMDTMQYTTLIDYSDNTYCSFKIYLYDGYGYTMRFFLREGGDKDNSEDYDKYVIRFDLTDFKEEKVMKIDDYTKQMIYIDSKGRLFYQSDNIGFIDINTGKDTVICDDIDGLLEKLSVNYYYWVGDEFIYFKYSGFEESKYLHFQSPYGKIIAFNCDTLEERVLVDKAATNYCATDNYVYYFPFDSILFYDMEVHNSGEVSRVNIASGEKELVMDLGKTTGIYCDSFGMRVLGKYLYLEYGYYWSTEINKEKGKDSDSEGISGAKFTIDLSNGEYWKTFPFAKDYQIAYQHVTP